MSEEASTSKQLTSFTKESLFELAAQNSTNCYIAIHENVYDVTQFLDEHPGGEEALKEHQIKNNKFKDATEAFEDVGHSMDARDMMKTYQIGTLVTEGSRSPEGSRWSWFLPALVLIGAAVAYQYFSHRV